MKKLIRNQDFVIPLAGLVGAPLCDKYPKLAKSVNLSSIIFIRKCLKYGTISSHYYPL